MPSRPQHAEAEDAADAAAQHSVGTALVEFADTAAFKRWYNSPEDQKILPGRLDNSTARGFVVEGVS